eukprot:TRINITY_DN71409_c0_g1_i1.p1 TRINITY_DN71409_c0_g1~~TRINITY_DN71409_c0_g1_i1.p1  ORF type:complete len:379 (+),score=76.17 TRINITY_DN71409_c0_g1_i1:136-1272(+)
MAGGMANGTAPRLPKKEEKEEEEQQTEARRWEHAAKTTDLELKAVGGYNSVACIGDSIVAGSSRGSMQLFQVAESKVTETRKLGRAAAGSSCVDTAEEADQLAAVCYDDGIIALWDLRQPQQICNLNATPAVAQKIKFFPGAASYKLASAGTAGSLAFWDLRMQQLDEEVAGDEAPSLPKKMEEPPIKRQKRDGGKKHSSAILSLAISPDAQLLGCGRASGDVCVMRLDTRTWAGDVSAHRSYSATTPVRALSFDASSRFLLSGGDDSHFCVLDAETWARSGSDELRWPQLERLPAHRKWVSSLAACPDLPQQFMVLTTSWDKTAKLWDLRTQAVQRTYEDHNGCITASAFTRSASQHFVTASSDGQLSVYLPKEPGS